MTLIGTVGSNYLAGTAPKRRRLADYAARPKPATRATSSCSPVRKHRGSIPEGAGPAGQPSHIFHRRCACPAPPLQWDGGDGGTMAKRRPTLPIAHADDLPTIAFTDEEWQAIENAYARQLNADVRQQITTVTTQYLKDCVFERTAAPKVMVRERIERIRRAAGDLESVMLDSKPFSPSTDELSREQQQSV